MTDLAPPTDIARRPLPAPCQAAIGRPADGTRFLHLAGVLDARSCRHLSRTMRTVLRGAPRMIVVDLRAVTHLNRSGAHLLILMRRQASRHGATLSLSGATPTVTTTLRDLDVTGLLRLHPTTLAAANARSLAKERLSEPTLRSGVPTERP